MVLDSSQDNQGVLDESGKRTLVSFIRTPGTGKEAHARTAGRGVFKAEIPQGGTYYVWARLWSEGPDCGPTQFVFEREGERSQDYVVQERLHKWWHWLPVTPEEGLELAPGTCTIVVQSPHDGARLSCILLTTESYLSYIPMTPEG